MTTPPTDKITDEAYLQGWLDQAASLFPPDGTTKQERGWLKQGATEVQRHWSFVDDGPHQEPNRVRNVTTWPDGSEYRSAWREVAP